MNEILIAAVKRKKKKKKKKRKKEYPIALEPCGRSGEQAKRLVCSKTFKYSLLQHGGDQVLVNWYYNYIKHRNLHIEIKGCSKTLSTDTGFPQGGVCSAKFWIIAFNEAIEI